MLLCAQCGSRCVFELLELGVGDIRLELEGVFDLGEAFPVVNCCDRFRLLSPTIRRTWASSAARGLGKDFLPDPDGFMTGSLSDFTGRLLIAVYISPYIDD
jgi:hypothetical protein